MHMTSIPWCIAPCTVRSRLYINTVSQSPGQLNHPPRDYRDHMYHRRKDSHVYGSHIWIMSCDWAELEKHKGHAGSILAFCCFHATAVQQVQLQHDVTLLCLTGFEVCE